MSFFQTRLIKILFFIVENDLCNTAAFAVPENVVHIVLNFMLHYSYAYVLSYYNHICFIVLSKFLF